MAAQPEKFIIGSDTAYCEGEMVYVRLRTFNRACEPEYNLPAVRATVIAIDEEKYPIAIVVGKTLEPFIDEEFTIVGGPSYMGTGTIYTW
jgi:hypothetical protein